MTCRALTFASGAVYKKFAFFIVNALLAFDCSYGARA
jgi:hypothetical protein